MIERALFVTTDLFEATTPGEHFINPRCFGEDFAVWLRDRLASEAIETSEPIQEDFGWVLLLGRSPRRFTLAVGVLDESIGKVPAVWRIGLSFERVLNGLRTWIRRPPVSELDTALESLRSVLSSEPRIRLKEEEPE